MALTTSAAVTSHNPRCEADSVYVRFKCGAWFRSRTFDILALGKTSRRNLSEHQWCNYQNVSYQAYFCRNKNCEMHTPYGFNRFKSSGQVIGHIKNSDGSCYIK
eukprot:Pgem_evm1s20240